jgi:tetratricopeptide (TPR) repeat protein
MKFLRSRAYACLLFLITGWCCGFPVSISASPSGQVLEIPLDARTTAMGSAAVSLEGDVAAMWYNPAGIHALRFPEVRASYRKDLDDMNFGSLNAALPLSPGVLGLGLQAFDAGKLDLGDGTQITAEQDFVLIAGYALDLATLFHWQFPLSAGLNAKYLRSTLAGEFTANAFAGDVGLQAGLPLPGLSLGAAYRNLGTGLKYSEETDELPATLDTGLSWSGALSGIFDLQVLADAWLPRGQSALAQAGLELGILKTLYLRSGYRFLHDTDSFTAGVGVCSHEFRLDYSFLQNQLAPKHLVTIGYRFGATEPAKPNNDSLALAAKGIALYKQGKLQEAKQAWSETLANNPTNPAAKEYLDNYTAEQRQWGAALHARATALLEQNDYTGASALWQEILTANPGDRNAQAGLARLTNLANSHVQAAKALQSRAQWPRALAELELALEIVPNLPAALQLRAAVYAVLNKQKQQMQRLIAATVADARRLAGMGEAVKAVSLLQSALAASPGQPDLLAAITEVPETAHRQALALKQGREYQAALAVWTGIMEVAPDFKPAKAAFRKTEAYYREQILPLDAQAAAAYQKVDYAKAITILEDRYRQAPEPAVATQLARAYLAQGILDYRDDRLPNSIKNWERAKTLDPNLPNIDRNLQRARNKLQFIRKLGWEVKQ